MKGIPNSALTWAVVLLSVGVFLQLSLLGHSMVTQLQERAEEQRRLEARLSLPRTADMFSVSTAYLERENGRFVVYSDGRAVEPFSGRFKVAMRNANTFRHAWTPEWSEWLHYRDNEGATRYCQPETLEWWTGIDDASDRLDPGEVWTMETCWQARVDDPVLGITALEPICIVATLGDRPAAKEKGNGDPCRRGQASAD